MKPFLTTLIRLPQMGLVAMVKFYRLLISPWLGSNCRFDLSCSAYALQALEHHGAVEGSYLTLRRVMRCQPWCAGGHDPVPPPQAASFFSRLLAPTASNLSKKTPS